MSCTSSVGYSSACSNFAAIGATVVHPPQDDDYAPGYYSVLFEDPDGVRLEVNHVPGQGLLTPGGSGHVGQPLA